MIKSLLNWLRTSCVISIKTVATWHIWRAHFCMGWLWTMYHRQGNKGVEKIIVSLCQCRRTAFEHIL